MKPSYRQLIYYSTLIMLTSIIVLTFCFSEDPIETFVVNYWWLLASVGIMMAVSGVIFLVYEACQRLGDPSISHESLNRLGESLMEASKTVHTLGVDEEEIKETVRILSSPCNGEKEIILHLYVDSLEDEWGPVLDALAREGGE